MVKRESSAWPATAPNTEGRSCCPRKRSPARKSRSRASFGLGSRRSLRWTQSARSRAIKETPRPAKPSSLRSRSARDRAAGCPVWSADLLTYAHAYQGGPSTWATVSGFISVVIARATGHVGVKRRAVVHEVVGHKGARGRGGHRAPRAGLECNSSPARLGGGVGGHGSFARTPHSPLPPDAGGAPCRQRACRRGGATRRRSCARPQAPSPPLGRGGGGGGGGVEGKRRRRFPTIAWRIHIKRRPAAVRGWLRRLPCRWRGGAPGSHRPLASRRLAAGACPHRGSWWRIQLQWWLRR
jgi:hypothetical protein